ncbi:DUF1496 domain-containing protein [Photobacterium phosphoreum]|uniref:DUF1496 domain-containing protein n=1 Tax=Photobacterium phosphoreum TaxID=659 RepID=UPI0009EF4700|nr:DUF1496 domain-containing protein [Photobacterium phosphoreum]
MHFLKHGWLVIIGVMGFVAISNAKQYSTDTLPIIQSAAQLQLDLLPQRHCLYAGKAYSLGAIIRTDNIVLECRSAQDIELNGLLKWVIREQSP